MSDTPVIVDWIKRLEQRVAALEEQNKKLIAAVARLNEPVSVLLAAG